MKKVSSSAKLMATFAFTAIAAIAAAAPNGYSFFWGDEFNLGVNKQANGAYWGYNTGNSGWGNNELENYTNKLANSHIVADSAATDGLALQIQAIETAPGSYTSARLLTQGKYAPKYGFIEARIRIPYGQGIWPAFWMLGSNINSVGWPACGEADIMENIGSYPNTNWGSLHAPSFDPSQTWVLNSPNVYHTDYHLFQASWTPNSFTFLVDGNVYHSQNINSDGKWPFNEPMFFILNVAVGGNWPGNPDSSTLFPQTMLADYVRIYHLTGPTSNEVISLFSSANSKFVSAENAGSSALDCNRTSASTWEQFLVVDLGSNKVALQSQANGKYVTVTTGKSPTLIADSDKIATASTFAWTPNADGTAYLKSMSLGRYVGVDTTENPSAMVVADVAPKAQDAFGITCYGQLAATSAPTAPQNLVVKAGPNSLKLTWSKVAGASSYQIYRSTLPGGSGMVPLASLTATTYTNSSLNWGIGYSYAVTALNSQGMSLRSSVVTASPLRG